LGLVFIIFGLLYIPVMKNLPNVLRTVINAIFVVGFSLALMVVDGIGNTEMALTTIGFFVFWMYTRIQLSQWNHSLICDGCDEQCPAKE
jgi:4-hydroxybenzoate polyprenyltransferase